MIFYNGNFPSTPVRSYESVCPFVLIGISNDLDVLLGGTNKYTGFLNILQISGL